MADKPVRLAFLDALRGIAAVWVVVFHVAMIPNLAVPDWLSWVILNGGSGVALFFVASAFSLCLTMPRHLAHPTPLVSFYASRFFRIAPLFYVMLVFLIARQYLAHDYVSPPSMIFANIGFAFNLVPGYETGMVAASWTIGIEMMFYLIFPAIYFLAPTLSRALAWMLVTMVISVAIRPIIISVLGDAAPRYLTYFFVIHLYTFAWGMIAFRLPTPSRAVGGPLLILSAMIFVLVATKTVNKFYWTGPMFAALLLGLSAMPLRAFVNTATGWLGKNSYSIYLLHPVVIGFVMPFYAPIYGLGIATTWKFALCAALTLAVVLPLSEVTYRMVERQGELFGRRFLKRRSLVVA